MISEELTDYLKEQWFDEENSFSLEAILTHF